MTDESLPTIIPPTASEIFARSVPEVALIPSMVADAGESAAWRYVDFFTSNIRNPNTRRAYRRACQTFFAWCEDRGLTLTTIRPYDVATYIETRVLRDARRATLRTSRHAKFRKKIAPGYRRGSERHP
jgi:Phage integrase, N-terminal SAM-like domain